MARPPKLAYKGMIIHYMVQEWLIFSYERNIGKRRYAPSFRGDIKYEPLTQTPTKLYHAIDRITKEKNWPTMSWTTLIKYLREMVADHTLIPPNGRRKYKYNEKPYRLSERFVATYFEYLIFGRGSIDQTPFGQMPYSQLLIAKLMVEAIRIEEDLPDDTVNELDPQRSFL